MTLAADALARNDRFLLEFVEAYKLCPFARRCRETGALERRVLPQADLTFDAPLAALRDLATDAFAHVEVALLLFPGVRCTFTEFERFAVALRDARAREEKRPTFFVVPFHPESPMDTRDPGRLVSFLRRSPDPTLQLVRAELLDRVRGPDTEDTIFVDPSTIDLANPEPLLARRPSLSTRIAEANFETVQRVGAERMRLLLASMHGR